LSKEQAEYCLKNMENYIDENGDMIDDAYDYKQLVDRLFI
jgi:hypothetical protein